MNKTTEKILVLIVCILLVTGIASSCGRQKTTSTVKKSTTSQKIGNASQTYEAESGFFKTTKTYLEEQQTWNPEFLAQVDFAALYSAYIKAGGDKNNVEDFAEYVEAHNPPPKNWKEIFEETIKENNGFIVTGYQLVDKDDQIYSATLVDEDDGSPCGGVAVNARTGYYHG